MIQKFSSLKVSDVLLVIALFSLTFPILAKIQVGSTVIFPHYPALALALPVFFLMNPTAASKALPAILIILISTIVNINTASIYIAVAHSLHIIAAALLASGSGNIALRFTKFSVISYSIAILTTQIFVNFGLEALVDGFFTQRSDTLEIRYSAFATEPSYAGMIMLILSRFIILADIDWMTPRRLILITGSMMASLSLFSTIGAILILGFYFLEKSNIRSMIIAALGGLAVLMAFTQIDYFASRMDELDLSLGLYGLNTGTTRLLPYIYMTNLLSDNVLPLFLGAGAGALDPVFFQNVGQYHTQHEHFSTGMAGPIYDYGAFVILVVFVLWNRPRGALSWLLYIIMAAIIGLNSGIGTYLFVLFGTYALLEQRLRSAKVII